MHTFTAHLWKKWYLNMTKKNCETQTRACLTLSFLFVAIPLTSELAVEIMEKGQVRFWLQAEKLSGNAKVNFVFNDKEIFNGEVRLVVAYGFLIFINNEY